MTVQQIRVDGVDIAYTETGSGPTVLFVHGVYVTGAVWNDVVNELGVGFRCVAPTWPLGAHSTPTGGADIGAEATARRIVHFMEALDLRDVTVVANDTGGGLVLTTLGDANLDKSRVGRLVLTNCDSYEHFPPGSFAPIAKLCRLSPTGGGAILRLLATGPGQSFFLNAVCRHAPTAPGTATRHLRRFRHQQCGPARRCRGDRVTRSCPDAACGPGHRGIRQTGRTRVGCRRPAVSPRSRPAT
jgi:pimeloyl-ACP methyl ester carboxylesterase